MLDLKPPAAPLPAREDLPGEAGGSSAAGESSPGIRVTAMRSGDSSAAAKPLPKAARRGDSPGKVSGDSLGKAGSRSSPDETGGSTLGEVGSDSPGKAGDSSSLGEVGGEPLPEPLPGDSTPPPGEGQGAFLPRTDLPPAARWARLEAEVASCRRCGLCETRKNVVIGDGDRAASLLFVGEAPGGREDETGVPFVGEAGELFNLYLEAVGIERSEVYICNILKCRPPRNRDPQPPEEDACIAFLREQVRLVDPKIICCLGRVAASRLIHPEFKITREHGQYEQKGKFLLTAVYHPALLLRDGSRREEMLRDMKELKRRYDEMIKEEGEKSGE